VEVRKKGFVEADQSGDTTADSEWAKSTRCERTRSLESRCEQHEPHARTADASCKAAASAFGALNLVPLLRPAAMHTPNREPPSRTGSMFEASATYVHG